MVYYIPYSNVDTGFILKNNHCHVQCRQTKLLLFQSNSFTLTSFPKFTYFSLYVHGVEIMNILCLPSFLPQVIC